ncbi:MULTISPECIES: hypothetical protein [Mycolicibacterium]|uniref:Uncharacterized protein n=1 Tax=Mycolicibacterium canariasense TaxID=228230 RepID=A0A124E1V6_MYCCR|nr:MULTISPECIES: hypothetical protein [Mycolicibacterium]MCC9179517.1 hypothetical protein [Mycolicibacterium mageritense]MCV7211478.1 hypothetical protein [Mycolicibacterium canariasense]ORV10508.1 hypothetical protein AWB94_07365 [Mycolicibacterium canariasense]GAS94860.1 uncharacterized protein RMCC_1826 [Mycolicibacterium canariasense]
MTADIANQLWPVYVPGKPIPELLKIATFRMGLRESGLLPPLGLDEAVAAFVDALNSEWFFEPDGTFNRARGAAALVEAWRVNPAPCAFMGARDWLSLFKLAQNEIHSAGFGYPQDAGPVEVFRGCRREHAVGLSWTSDFLTAVWFAMRQRSRGFIGEVYRAVVPADAVLADFRGNNGARQGIITDPEQELVIDPGKLGAVHRVVMRLDDKELLLRKWLTRARLIDAAARARGYTPMAPPSIAIEPEPEGGWAPYPQSVYPEQPGYRELPRTPSHIIWPRADEVEFFAEGGGVGMVGRVYHDTESVVPQ